jgi:hypothetical protein
MAVVVRIDIGDNYSDIITPSVRALDAVLFDFNPSTSSDVAVVKGMCAAVIQKMIELRDGANATDPMKRMASIAISQMEITQMCAVKSYFAK